MPDLYHTHQHTLLNTLLPLRDHDSRRYQADTTQRGGAGNVLQGDPPAGPAGGGRAEQDYTPEPSTTDKHQENFHTGVCVDFFLFLLLPPPSMATYLEPYISHTCIHHTTLLRHFSLTGGCWSQYSDTPVGVRVCKNTGSRSSNILANTQTDTNLARWPRKRPQRQVWRPQQRGRRRQYCRQSEGSSAYGRQEVSRSGAQDVYPLLCDGTMDMGWESGDVARGGEFWRMIDTLG